MLQIANGVDWIVAFPSPISYTMNGAASYEQEEEV
jgi:hypothetical protein